MLELRNIFFEVGKGEDAVALLKEIDLQVPSGHFMAIVGPSGCGKSTLLKLIAGINQETDGVISWNGRNLSEDGDLEAAEIGYVPQFSIAYESLTVEENLTAAVRLRVETESREEVDAIVEKTLAAAGMVEIRDRMVKVLSGGQRRRLSLALELVTNPLLLLCDEVTSGLDPKSEEEIIALMYQISREGQRIVVNVTHSLASLDLYDSVLVLDAGQVIYHGPPRALEHYFSIERPEEVYMKLASRSTRRWVSSWEKHRRAYDAAMAIPLSHQESTSATTPGALAQFLTLFSRRWKLFFRDKGQLFLQLAILVIFPILVVIFAPNGVESIRRLSETLPTSLSEYEADRSSMTFNLNLGGLVSGLVMFEVILLTLMGANNSAREIAGERAITEKEKLGGVRSSAYVASKIAFLSILVAVQSLWMAFFVQTISELPTSNFFAHFLLLLLVNGAMTAVCLGISAFARTADQASLLSIYLVGFQLPLSGAVLALPGILGEITRPFISAYWSWAGAMDGMDSKYHRYIVEVTDTWLASAGMCMLVLGAHIIVGLSATLIGAQRPRWEN